MDCAQCGSVIVMDSSCADNVAQVRLLAHGPVTSIGKIQFKMLGNDSDA